MEAHAAVNMGDLDRHAKIVEDQTAVNMESESHDANFAIMVYNMYHYHRRSLGYVMLI